MTGPTPAAESRLVPLAGLVLDDTVQVRDTLDDGLIDDYAATYRRDPDAMPALVAYDTPEGLLLVDGFHRVAAARRAGCASVPVEVHHGNREDAMEAAATANAKNGQRLDRAGIRRAARRPLDMHPDWGYRPVARALGVGHMTVQRALKAPARPGSSRRQRAPAITTLDRLLALTRLLAREKPEQWAEAVVAEHLREYEGRGEPPDIGPLIERLRLLLVHLENRRRALPGYSLHVPED